MRTLRKIAVGGFTSNSGKTTLLCELLRALPGWEAIKTTRGHYRSCGKDPHACCVSPLLGDEPVVRSGRAETYAPGKDTGRYWDAGAANVHWVIATDRQVERGVREALGRVRAPGVLLEGNSFQRYLDVDFVVLTARADDAKIKPTARGALARADALYLSVRDGDERGAQEVSAAWRARQVIEEELFHHIPLYTRAELPHLLARAHAALKAAA